MSNLIEQLGGYEAAKRAIENGVLKDWAPCTYEVARRELLEYRRANNIFEEFDMLAYMEVSDIGKIYRMVSDKPNSEGYIWMMGKGGLVYENIKYLIHATDAEIKAGHRLPQLEVLDDPNTIILGDR